MTRLFIVRSMVCTIVAVNGALVAAADFDYLRVIHWDLASKAHRQIASCVVARYPQRAQQAVDQWFDQPNRNVPEKMLGSMSCGPGDYPFSFQLDTFLLMKMVSELLIKPETIPLDLPSPQMAPADGWAFADCALAAAPDEVFAVLRTQAFSRDELKAMRVLAAKMEPCVGQKRTKLVAAAGVRTGLRGYLAATLYYARRKLTDQAG